MELKGQIVTLRPMREDEMIQFYNWATQSDATPFWYGDKIPSLEEFLKDWKPHYFDGSRPELGRCFVILLGEQPIGQINYNAIDPGRRNVEIDIIIPDASNCGKGYGSDAIRTLLRYLSEQMQVMEVWVAARDNNPRAIKAYQKAGFDISGPPEGIRDKEGWTDKNLDEWVFLCCKKLV